MQEYIKSKKNINSIIQKKLLIIQNYLRNNFNINNNGNNKYIYYIKKDINDNNNKCAHYENINEENEENEDEELKIYHQCFKNKIINLDKEEDTSIDNNKDNNSYFYHKGKTANFEKSKNFIDEIIELMNDYFINLKTKNSNYFFKEKIINKLQIILNLYLALKKLIQDNNYNIINISA